MVEHYKDSNIWLNFKKSFDSNELSHAYIIESDSINLGELIALDGELVSLEKDQIRGLSMKHFF